MSILSEGFPCSRLRTKQSPTPDFIARSSCVRPYSLRNAFTTADNCVFAIMEIILYRMQNYVIFFYLYYFAYKIMHI